MDLRVVIPTFISVFSVVSSIAFNRLMVRKDEGLRAPQNGLEGV